MKSVDLRARLKAVMRGTDEFAQSEGPRAVAEEIRAHKLDAAIAGSTVVVERDEIESPARAATRGAVLDDVQRRYPDVLIVEVTRLSPSPAGNAKPTQTTESTGETPTTPRNSP